jgi:hypothetical protein
MSVDVNTDDDLGAAPFKAELLRQVEPAGIGGDRIDVEYQAELQDFEVRVGGGELSDEQIALLREATRFGGCLVFTNTANSLRRFNAQARDGSAILKARAAELIPKLVGLPRFDPAETTLATFALELEAYCGFEPGTALLARNNAVEVRAGRDVGFDQFQRLLDAVTAALAHHDDVRVFTVGQSI